MLQTYREARHARGEATGTYELCIAALTDHMFRVPADRLAEAQATHLRKVFAYRFDLPSPVGEGALGACHGLEIPFVFGTQSFAPTFAGEGTEVDELASKIGDAWVAFSRTGDPTTSKLRWPAFDGECRRTMILDRECRVDELPRDAERRCWDGVVA